MKKYLAYIRVSTPRQGEHGYSLAEQRDDINAYAARHGLHISDWFEDRKTAAKLGRPQFNLMLEELRRGRADGAIIHKIDRSARNQMDWAWLGVLLDKGVEVHSAHDGYSLNTRSARLTADILAAVASDYVRNLREEAIKGQRGCLKQGLLPLPAPVGYLDKGAGRPKEPDPAKAVFVRRIFELYASGRHSFDTLVEEAWAMGLRNRRGARISANSLTSMLNNPFYAGIIKIKRSGATYPGAHEPIISVDLFERVQYLLRGRSHTKPIKQRFLFRRMLRCVCGYNLIGERQKGHVYYRCHTKSCAIKSVREDTVRRDWNRILEKLTLNPEEQAYIAAKIPELRRSWDKEWKAATEAVRIRLGQLDTQLDRLTDAYIEGLIEKEAYETKKQRLLLDRKALDHGNSEARIGNCEALGRIEEFLALIREAKVFFQACNSEERRSFLEIVTSNRVIERKKLIFIVSEPFRTVAERPVYSYGGSQPDIARTWDRIFGDLIAYFASHPDAQFPLPRERSSKSE